MTETDSILEMLQRELDLCGRLQQVSQELHNRTQARQFDKLDTVMQDRAAVLQELQSVDDRIRDCQETMQTISQEQQAQGRAVAEQIVQLLVQISQLDEETEKALQEQKETVLQGLKNLNIGKSLDDQYRSAERGAGGSFVDVRE